MKILEFIRTLRRTPESQPDPHHWASTGLAHYAMGQAVAMLFMLFIGQWGAAVAVLGYWALWEKPQARESGLWADSALDWSMWSLGCLFAYLVTPGIDALAAALAALVILWAGLEIRT